MANNSTITPNYGKDMNQTDLEALVHSMNGARLNERRRIGREIIAEFKRLRTAAAGAVAAWHRGWDCSANPGHPNVDDAIAKLSSTLGDLRHNDATEKNDG